LRRSAFLSSASALAPAAFLRDVALAAEDDALKADLVPLVETLLPFGAPSFPPVRSAALVHRIDDLFKLDGSQIFQASLRGFSSLAAFAAGAQELFAAERAAVPDADGRVLLARDGAAFAASGLSATAAFGDLDPAGRGAYLRLWSQSAFSTRRRFYASVRAVTFVAFYSLPEAWPAIGYAGPFRGAHAR
jgi:hypothetical protein